MDDLEAPKKKTSFTFKLDKEQQETLVALLEEARYKKRLAVPFTVISVEGPECIVNLYTSGKCLVQGKGAEDFVLFTMEPLVLKCATLGYEDTLDPSRVTPHMGSDESGKGDFFGPLVACAAYTDPELSEKMRDFGVKDCKLLSDSACLSIAEKTRALLGPKRFAIVQIGPEAYNRLYAKIRTVNRLLAWAHARCIENLLTNVPDCPRAVSDQFGDPSLIKNALMKNGRKIELEQHHKAESDIAVAAASVLARAAFLYALRKIGQERGIQPPKGCSDAVQKAAVELVKKDGPLALLSTCKCHFRTTDQILAACGLTRAALGEAGAAISRPRLDHY